MFCVAAFIILAFLSAFSARYRSLAASAWRCTGRKITFRKCDTTFKQDLKDRLLGNLALRRPRLTRWLERWIEVLAFVFVMLTVWSLLMVIRGGIHLYVYGTCTPEQPEACAVGADACGIDTGRESWWQLTRDGQPQQWFVDEWQQWGDTLEQLPNRWRSWDTPSYVPDSATYYSSYDPERPTAIEVIDPGCLFCKELFHNLRAADVHQTHNLTYLLYPIELDGEYQFQHSPLVARYLEATRQQPLQDATPPADWQLLERIFTEEDERGVVKQRLINGMEDEDEVEQLLTSWLRDIGYSAEEVERIQQRTESEPVAQALKQQRQTVENDIQTVMIPTLLLGDDRFDGIVEPEQLE